MDLNNGVLLIAQENHLTMCHCRRDLCRRGHRGRLKSLGSESSRYLIAGSRESHTLGIQPRPTHFSTWQDSECEYIGGARSYHPKPRIAVFQVLSP